MRDTSQPHLGLMRDLIERKIRLQAHQLYETRGKADGRALEDWLRAESEVLKTSILAPLWYSQHHERLTSTNMRPASYDSGYEHSREHWMELRQMMDESDDEPSLELTAVCT